MLHSICQQFRKFNSDHRTGKGQFSFQSQRKAMQKQAQYTAQLHSSHTLVEEGNGNHSSTLAWKIPWMEEPSMLQSMWSRRVRHYWATSLSLFTFMHWRMKFTHCIVLAWGVPGMAEPGGLLSMWSHRIGWDWSDLAAAAAAHASKLMLILQASLQQYMTWTMKFQVFKLVLKRQRNQRSNCQHLLDHWKSKKVPEKHLFLLYWLCQSLWLCGSQ